MTLANGLHASGCLIGGRAKRPAAVLPVAIALVAVFVGLAGVW